MTTGAVPSAPDRRRDPEGNRLLLAGAGVALLVLLGVEYLTLLLGLDSGWIGTHVFVGLVLIPVVAYKLAVAAYRFARYYTRDRDYHDAGPPRLLLRVVAPVLAIASVALLGSGVLLVTGHHADRDTINGVHHLSFIVLSAAVAVHVLAYLLRSLSGLGADLVARTSRAFIRIAVLCLVVIVGLLFAWALPHHSGRGDDHGDFRDRGVAGERNG